VAVLWFGYLALKECSCQNKNKSFTFAANFENHTLSRNKKNLPIITSLEITDVAAEGNAIGKADDIVVFVPHAIPGDIVDVQIKKKRSSYMEGTVLRFEKLSPMRIEPRCEHFGVCGGCKWQDLPYEKQLFYKEKQVNDNLKRIGKITEGEVFPIIPSDNQYYYRNKLEFTFSASRWLTSEEIGSNEEVGNRNALGFHIPGLFDKVLDIRHCHLQADPSNGIRLELKAFAEQQGYTFGDLRQHTGFLRNLIIRTSSTGEIMVIVSFGEENREAINHTMNFLTERFPEITSLMYVINQKLNDTTFDLPIIFFSGKDHMMEKMEELYFKIGPKSFYQTNSLQAYKLYSVTREFSELKGDEIIYDLYTGTGTIANFVAKKCRKVIGVELIKEAIDDARVNSEINNITNTTFHAGDIKDVFTSSFIEAHGRPDVVILDPPRAGVHENVIESLLKTLPEKIVYVSCNPATQARDIALLNGAYAVEKIQPVDMFPQTHHVENVVMMRRRD
jgi:23S rRNA (uracil1939-C5)-methyltransferase